MKNKIILIVVLLVVLVISYVVYTKRDILMANIEAQKAVSYVTLDINPSVELAVDENDTVVDTVTLNEDADIAYNDLNLVGKPIEDATGIIIDEAVKLGYITEVSDTNAVNVTSYTEDETKRINLNKKIVDKLNSHFESRKIYTLVVENGLDDELKAKADSYSIPYGKMLLVARAMKLDSTLVESDLVKLSIKEIQAKIKIQAVNRREEVKNAYKEAKQEFKDIKTQRIAEAKVKLQQEKEALLKGVDKSNLTSEEKQALIEQRKKQIKEEIQDAKEDLKQSGATIKDNVKETIRDKYLLKRK
ncbi:MAG: hypothetical protein K0R72_192 [Clostridia bacterium]|jgi:hypothetical protein|nr:hypothetical protein [Clostridia bacterium]